MPKKAIKRGRRRSKFAEMLATKRTALGLTQRALSKKTDLSASFIALLELDQRGSPEPTLSREQVWGLIKTLKMWPPECDRFLEAAGHEADRSADEEIDIQSELEFEELWIFARYPMDAEGEWFNVVSRNIDQRGIAYRYFIEDRTPFFNLLHRLKREKRIQETKLKDLLECTIVPAQFFISNFALYITGRRPFYGCGTKLHEGRPEKFYAMHSSETSRLFELLRKWRDSLRTEQSIEVNSLRRIFPPGDKRSEFIPETSK